MHIKRNTILISALFGILVFLLAGCSAAVSETTPSEPHRPKILIGQSTKADVEALFGPPTDILNREEEVWVYRGLKLEDVAGLIPFYCGDKPLVFHFALDGTVSRISRRVPAL